MSQIFVLLFMFFMHVLDDYKIQAGVLNSLKTRSYWKENAPDKLYEKDYIMGLIMHAISWSFCIMLPLAAYFHFDVGSRFFIIWAINAVIHGTVDDLKANRHKLNLIQDQLIHIVQILLTFGIITLGGV